MVTRDEELVVYPSPRKLLGLCAASIIFVLIGGGMIAISLSEEDSSVPILVIGLISILFFGLCLIYVLYRLLNKKPSIVLDDQGIMDDSSYIGGGLLRWDQIEEIMLYDFMGQRFIGLKLVDTQAFLTQQSGLKKVLIKLNRGMVKAPVNISQQGVTMPLGELYVQMMERWERSAQLR
ncbi:STM3941 family protein [Paenibacillus spongiae]|uniref:PH domain-containing protein n=1 Tax=Paenibacillus spongiae TaxID=2909671 RepID=A0ABY5SA61_9BACL|nr:STM3941 family protein [Paenibacillus spongiae]UVI30804.1 hypothetical protein L1F29_02695 [Paenibacillus spongiae]